jgi:hypothetical protein
MATATRLDSDMGGWMPVARHYAVEGGWLVVVVCNFLTATGTDVFYADETAGAQSMEPIAKFPDGTNHDEALTSLGYEVVDTIPEISVVGQTEPEQQALESSVLDMLPPEIAQMVAGAGLGQTIETTNTETGANQP